MIRRRRPLALLLTVSVLVTAPFGLAGCNPGDPVGSLLSGVTDQINSVITRASAEAQATVLAAAGALQAAVSQAESAFATDLNTGINNVNDAVRNDVKHLQTLLAQLQSGNAQLVQQALAGAQQLLNTLPFTNKNPQVTSYSPTFVVGGQQVVVRVHGNFFYAFEKKLTPTLDVGGTTYPPARNTTQDLAFIVPASKFAAPTNGDFSYTTAELHVKYEHGVIFHSITPGVFRLLVTTLPTTPTKSATLTTTTTVNGTSFRHLVTPPTGQYALESYDCQDHSAKQTVLADPGWKIDPSSVQANYSVLRNPTRTSLQITRSTAGLVIVYSTQSNCIGPFSDGSGDMAFNVSYTEEQPTSTTTQTQTPIPIHWGDVLSQPVTRNQWRFDATLFNGSLLQVTDTDHSNPYLTVDNNGANVSEASPAPDALVQGAAARRAEAALTQVGGSTTLSVRPDSAGRVIVPSR